MIVQRTTIGIMWMLAAQVVFVTVWSAIKHLGGRIPLFELVFFRAAISLIVLLPLTHWRHKSFRGHAFVTLFLRAFFGFLAMVFGFYAMTNMELGNAVTLFNTFPIFVALLAPSLLDERFSRLQFAFALAAFAGIAMVLRPDANILQGASVYALLAAILAALSMICIRKLGRTDSVLIITLYFTAFTTMASAPMAAIQFVKPTASEWGYLIFIGVAVTFAQLFLTKAFKHAAASTIAPFSYLSVIGSYIAGFVLFSEVTDPWSAIGAAIIIAAGTGVMLSAPKAQRVPGSVPGVRT